MSANKNNDVRDFTQGSVPVHLSRLTGFMMLGLVSLMGANLIEAVYIGRLGTQELAAISFTFPLVMLFQGVAMGLSIGTSSVVARLIGSGDMNQAKILISHCCLLVFLIILVLCPIAYFNADIFFSLLGAEDDILPLTVSFIQIWILGLPFFTVAMVGSTLMRAAGDAVTPGYLMAIGSGLHVLISPIFIFGLGGAPALGLDGAAVGFVLARFVSFLMYSYVMAIRDKLMIYKLVGFVSSCRQILHVGLPAMASNMIQPVSMSVITKLLAGHGAAVVAGFGVASRIESIVMIVIIAQSMSVAPFIGQNWGAAFFDRVKYGFKLANSLAVIWGIVAYVFLFFSAEFLVTSINSDPAVVEPAVRYLLILPLGIGFMGIMMNASSCFNALGKPMPPLVLSVLQMIVVMIPLAMIGDYLYGYLGMFVGVVSTVIGLAIVSWFWIQREIRQGIALKQLK